MGRSKAEAREPWGESPKPLMHQTKAEFPMDGATVYLLECADGSLYTGITRRTVEERVSEHQLGISAGYTFSWRPVRLIWSEHFVNLTDAILCERRIKGWSRAKKRALAAGDWRLLQDLSIAYRDRASAAPSS